MRCRRCASCNGWTAPRSGAPRRKRRCPSSCANAGPASTTIADPRDGESLYLTLREPGSRRSGFWLLHPASDSLAQWSPDLPTGNLLWRLEDQYAGRVLCIPGSTALLDDMQTLGVEPLRNSDWASRRTQRCGSACRESAASWRSSSRWSASPCTCCAASNRACAP
ncbi:hypothetical protein [Pseudomonas aeruginosa]|uniref:hypothetical protein n=1 Tax=Pseudomonas aeruginosa TaxID=287 RepID=UPI0021A99C71|nr:hypothetical protein [Pseudomonas aeruginosa]